LKPSRPIPTTLLSITLPGSGVLSWAALFMSLEQGRTTPLRVSRAWLADFIVVAVSLLTWTLLFRLLLSRLVSNGRSVSSARATTSASPLLLSAPFLLASYLSDEAYHYLSTNPIPRSLVLWAPPLAMLAWQEAALVWAALHHSHLGSRGRMRNAPPLLIFAAFAALYIFTAGGHLYSPDEREMYLVTSDIAERGSVATHVAEPRLDGAPSSNSYSKYGLVPSLLALPPYWISKLVGPAPDPPSSAFPIPNGAYPLVDLLTGPLVTAATCALLYSTARRLGFRASTSLILIAAYGLGTSAWVYSKTFFSQPPATLFLLLSIYLLVFGGKQSPRVHALAGISLGLAVGSRAEIAILAFPLAVPLALSLKRDGQKAWKPLLAFAVGLATTGGTTLAWYNYVKTGSVFATGHGAQGTIAGFSSEPYVGLFGALFSPGFGFLLYNPVVLLGILSFPLLARARPLEARLLGGMLALAILFYGSIDEWFGGFTWGNRYLVIVLPLAILPTGALLERCRHTFLPRLLAMGVLLLGILISLLAVLFDFNNGWLDLWDRHANIDLVLWDPHFSPIGAHLRLLHDFLYTGAKLDLYLYYKLGIPALLVCLLVFTGLSTLAVGTALASDLDELYTSSGHHEPTARLRPPISDPASVGSVET